MPLLRSPARGSTRTDEVPPLLAESLNQQATPPNSQTSVTVPHEDLRWVSTAVTTPLGGLHSRQGVTNVLAEYT